MNTAGVCPRAPTGTQLTFPSHFGAGWSVAVPSLSLLLHQFPGD